MALATKQTFKPRHRGLTLPDDVQVGRLNEALDDWSLVGRRGRMLWSWENCREIAPQIWIFFRDQTQLKFFQGTPPIFRTGMTWRWLQWFHMQNLKLSWEEQRSQEWPEDRVQQSFAETEQR